MMRRNRVEVKAMLDELTVETEKGTISSESIATSGKKQPQQYSGGKAWAHAAWQHLNISNTGNAVCVELEAFAKDNAPDPSWLREAREWFMDEGHVEAAAYMTDYMKAFPPTPAEADTVPVVMAAAEPKAEAEPQTPEGGGEPEGESEPECEHGGMVDPEVLANLTDEDLKGLANEIAEMWATAFGTDIGAEKLGEAFMVPSQHLDGIRNHTKHMLISDQLFATDESFIIVSDDGKAHGLIALEDARTITPEDFNTPSMHERHRMTDEERKQHWPEAKKLYAYEIRSFAWFDEPSDVSSTEFTAIRKMSREDLVNAAAFVLQEAKRRGIDLGLPDDLMRAIEALGPQEREVEKADDQHMVPQNGKTKYPFVAQHHFRGLWSQAERTELKKQLEQAKSIKDPDEAKKFIDHLWSSYKIESMKAPLDQITRAATAAAERGDDVSASIRKLLDEQPPSAVDLPKVIPNIVNRGNVHTDLRMKSPNGDWLIGWTMDTPGIALQTVDGRLLRMMRNKFIDNQPGDNIVVQRKDKQPLAWLGIVKPGKAVYRAEPGEVGGTQKTAGEFRYIDRGDVIFGVQKSDYHELFLFFEKNKQLNGRWGIQRIEGQAGQAPGEYWMANRPKEQAPYIETHNIETETEKAKRENIAMVWNPETIDALKAVGYKDMSTTEVSKFVPILKDASEERTVFGVVLEPETVDAHGDVISPDEIKRAAYTYMEWYQQKGFQHGKNPRYPAFPEGLRLLESYLAPVAFEINGRKVKQGTWLMRMRVDHDGLWNDVKTGRVTGFSIGGFARAVKEAV